MDCPSTAPTRRRNLRARHGVRPVPLILESAAAFRGRPSSALTAPHHVHSIYPGTNGESGTVKTGSLPLLKGTLDLLVLKALTWGPMHGYGIASWLRARSGRALDVEDSPLYQALHRLEGRRLVKAEWGG